MKDQKLISQNRIRCIREQGYFSYSDVDISALSFGNRFAYLLCSAVLIVGVITASVPILSVMLAIAFLGVVLPYHPFDYIYNLMLRTSLNKPKLPPRSKQLKFACLIATLFLIATIYLFYSGNMTAGYIVGAILISSAVLVGTADVCIPSILYNYMYSIKH